MKRKNACLGLQTHCKYTLNLTKRRLKQQHRTSIRVGQRRYYLPDPAPDTLQKYFIHVLSAKKRRMTETTSWEQNGWIEQSQIILDSYDKLLGKPLVDRNCSISGQAEQLFHAPFVVVCHGTQSDPLLSYANQLALELWKISIPVLLQTPSRMTAEPVHRDERAELLARTTRDATSRTITINIRNLWCLARLARRRPSVRESPGWTSRTLGVGQATSGACLARDAKEALVVR